MVGTGVGASNGILIKVGLNPVQLVPGVCTLDPALAFRDLQRLKAQY
jgi:hypothetical protein